MRAGGWKNSETYSVVCMCACDESLELDAIPTEVPGIIMILPLAVL